MGRIEKTVFVSYRRTDEPWALAVFENLTQHGYDVFIDYDGIASGSFETAILENIKARAHFLALLTPTALERCGDPKDWMRREIEAALDSQRNIVPLMLAGFDFGRPPIAGQLTGKLATLKQYNGLPIPEGYFPEAMERLRNKFLSISLDTVLHPASDSAQQVAKEQKDKATMALRDEQRKPGDRRPSQLPETQTTTLDRIAQAAISPEAAPGQQEDAKGPLPGDAKRNGAPAARYEQGYRLRRETPRERHADLGPRDPVAVLASGDRTRVPELVPVRYERMLASPYAFFRGAAAVMAQDLKHEPSAGIAVQACGDCDLMNFGASVTPEENILFDINDFDETLPGVDFTVDLKRLAASAASAALAAKFSNKRARAAAATTVAAYRLRMGALAKLSPLNIRHNRIDLAQEIRHIEDRKLRKRLQVILAKATKTAEDDNFPQLVKGKTPRIQDRPPLIYHFTSDKGRRLFDVGKLFASYKKSLTADSLHVFEQYTLRDTAFVVTGVGSVGTFRAISLFTSRKGPPLFLQTKEAGRSVLECLGPQFDGPLDSE
jgi:Uncharacterized protein conserved in bacteria (DUF2252)/TIR domain